MFLERIRQIEKIADRKLGLALGKILSCSPLVNIKQIYRLFFDDLITDVSDINKQDKTNFSDDFLYQIVSTTLKDYELVSTNKNNFLIKKYLRDIFDFKKFIADMKSKLEKSNYDHKLNFKGLLFDYVQQKSDEIETNKVETICEKLLNTEFNIIVDIDGQILIKGKNKKNISHYTEEILKNACLPTHLDDIYTKIKKQYPEFKKSKRYLANSFVQNNKFIFFDCNSTYGLKSWEGEWTESAKLIEIVKPNKTNNERSGIKVWSGNGKIIVKGGSTIDIVREYLSKTKKPKHIDDILLEVEKWRDTSKQKLLANLNLNNRRYFIFYENNLIGLVDE